MSQTYKGQVTTSGRPYPDANLNAVVHTSHTRGDLNATHFKGITGPITEFCDGGLWDEGANKAVSIDSGNIVGTPRPS